MVNYQARMQALLDKADADVVALVPGANLVYFTGLHFHLSERPIVALIDRDGVSFILPELEMPKLQQRPDLEARAFIWNDRDGYDNAFVHAVRDLKLGARQLGVDGHQLCNLALVGLPLLKPLPHRIEQFLRHVLHALLAVDHEGQRPREVKFSLVAAKALWAAATATLGKRADDSFGGEAQVGEDLFASTVQLLDGTEQFLYIIHTVILQ